MPKLNQAEIQTYVNSLTNKELGAHLPVIIARLSFSDGAIVLGLWERYARASKRLRTAEGFILNLGDDYRRQLLDQHLHYQDEEVAPGEDDAF